ncbi:hypothetical protein GCM10010123_10880 [Pilimelia anulata]|uniref:Major facilitator superfamily (MFS) profile domain-containing protein n=1 Tax=Pilimelia anulata TaxID=53371 RepID=A0A8J3F7X2_9ACTN|nr:MFS transporter [Pilimelia anulata]GGJ83095.1 hypothetical protein GCM10010123_10880 [Pilimelia anulata]
MGRGWWAPTALATAGMAVAMAPLYAVSALAPLLVAEFGLSRAGVGGVVTATFAVAAAGSLVAGHAADLVGARRCLVALGGVVAVALAGASLAGSYAVFVAAVAVAGVGQALANPATNLLVAGAVPGPRRATAIGIKQSGVQVAAFACGLLLPVAAAAWGWRGALRVVAAAAVLLAVVAPVVVAASAGRGGGAWWRWRRPSRWLGTLVGYSLLLGTGLAAVNAYLPLFAGQRLGLGVGAAGAVLAVFGVAGVVGRVAWARWADRPGVLGTALLLLPVLAGGFGALLWAADAGAGALVWVAALGIGATATGANAVSMVAVVRRGGAAGHASGLVSLGFFSGFVVGPAGFGALADAAGYGVGWGAVAVVFAAAGAVAVVLRRVGDG